MSEPVSSNRIANATATRGFRWFRWGVIASGIILLFPFCLFLFVSFYKPEIIAVMNREISLRYNADIHFDDVNISLWKTFPRTSLMLENLSVKNPLAADSILLKSERVYLTVDILSLFNNEVVFDGIRIDRADMSWTEYKNGTSNWEIFSSDSTSSTIYIEDVVLNNCRFRYAQLGTKWISHFTIDRAKVKGDMMRSDSNFDMAVSFEIDSLMSAENSYRTAVPIEINAHHVERKGDRIQCKNFECTSGDVKWRGDVDLSLEEQKSTHVLLETFDTPLDELIMVLPRRYLKELTHYSLDGESDLKLELDLGPNEKSLHGIFQLRDGQCIYEDAGELNGIFADIEFGTNEGGYCEIKKSVAATESGKLALGGRLNFAKSGHFQGSLQYDGPLEELAAMSSAGEEYQISGKASIQASLEGILFDKNARFQPKMQEGNGQIRIQDAKAFIPAINSHAEHIQIEADVNTGDVKIKSLSLLLNGSHFQVTGVVVNPLEAFSQQSSLQMTDLIIHSDQLNIQNWNLQSQSRDTEKISRDKSASMIYALKGNFICKNVISEGLSLNDFNCAFDISPDEIQLNSINTGIADGQIQGALVRHVKDFEGHFSFDQIDIQQLFQQTNHFGQSKITSQNISGLLSGSASITAALDSNGNMIKKTLWMESDITIQNGRLRDYAPLIDLVNFVEENKMLSVFTNEVELRRKLSDVEFSDLQNTLKVQDGQIIIPEMTIASSAFDITAKGYQSFDGVIDYHMGFNIFEVIRNKEKPSDKSRNNIFIHMFGTTDEPKFEVDKEWIKLPDFKLPSFLEERKNVAKADGADEAVIESANADTTKDTKKKLPSLIKNRAGETRKWLKEKN